MDIPIPCISKAWIIGIVLLLGSICGEISAQGLCTYSFSSGPEAIIDEDSIVLRLNVLESDFPEIGTNFQAICEVRIEFSHTNISDLTVRLRGPSGQDILLVGPYLPGQIRSALFPIDHFLTFIPNGTINTFPAPGYNDRWNNLDNLNWGTTSPVVGVHHPFEGRLDRYTSGTILGVWELIITDHQVNDIGEIEGFDIVFCEDGGLLCGNCEASAGDWVSSDTLYICSGDTEDLTALFQSTNPDPTQYTDHYVIYERGTNDLVQLSEQPDLSMLPAGEYNVHTINILDQQFDDPQERATIESWTITELIDTIQSGVGPYCMAISPQKKLMINEPLPAIRDTARACFGDIVMQDGIEIRRDTAYSIFSETCDLEEIVVVVFDTLEARFDQDQLLLDCITNAADFGAVVTSSKDVSYSWLDAVGQEISSDSMYTFTAGGNFELAVSAGVCRDTLALDVMSSSGGAVALVTARPASLNCETDTVQLFNQTTGFVADSVIQWKKDGVIIPMATGLSVLNVTESGLYELELVNVLGCSISDQIQIDIDQQKPIATLRLDTLSCMTSSFTASFSTSSSILPAIWTLPDQTTFVGDDLLVTSPGMYSLLLEDSGNGCDSLYTFEVMADTTAIVITDVPTQEITLNCEVTEVIVEPALSGEGIEEAYWLIGGSDRRNERILRIDSAANYQYIAISENGCQTMAEFDVMVDTLLPTYDLSLDSITCANPMAILEVSNLAPNTVAEFSASQFVNLTDTTITLDRSTTVRLTVTDTLTGCSISEEIEIQEFREEPEILLPDTLFQSCVTPNLNLEPDLQGMMVDDLYWVFPNGDTMRRRLEVARDAGMYLFHSTATNGCQAVDTVVVIDDLDIPVATLPSDVTLTCASPNLQIDLSGQTSLIHVQWVVGEDTLRDFTIDQPVLVDNVEVIFTGDNGCDDKKFVQVLYDTSALDFDLIGGTLDCHHPTVVIEPDEAFDNHIFNWSGPESDGADTRSVTIATPGGYQLFVVDTITGCGGDATVEIHEDFTLPQYVPNAPEVISCNNGSATLSVQTNNQNVIGWLQPSGDTIFRGTELTTVAGDYPLVIIGPNGCSQMDTITVTEDFEGPEFSIETDLLLSCNEPVQTLMPTLVDQIIDLYWTYDTGVEVRQPTIQVQDQTLISVTAQGVNECLTTKNFNISYSTDIPDAQILDQDTVVCSGQSIRIESSALASSDHRPIWFRDGVFVTDDETEILVDRSGLYELQVIDTTSGCSSRDMVQIDIHPEPFRSFEVTIRDESCVDEQDGILELNAVNGGVLPLDVLRNGVPMPIPFSETIAPGTYDLSVMDSLGCMMDTMVTIASGQEIFVSLSPNVTIERGESTQLVADITGSPADQIIWSDANGSIGEVGATLGVSPAASQPYYIEVITSQGCIAQDSVFVNVFVDVEQVELYVPNILAIGNANGNNEITLSLPYDVTEVTDFSIYDRWGQQVAYASRIEPGQDIVIWDGMIGASEALEGVYVYFYKMLTIYDPFPRVRTGDITVIR